jgi:hypothetical protein
MAVAMLILKTLKIYHHLPCRSGMAVHCQMRVSQKSSTGNADDEFLWTKSASFSKWTYKYNQSWIEEFICEGIDT